MFECSFCKRNITSRHYYWDDYDNIKYEPIIRDGKEVYIHKINRDSICIECLRAKGISVD